MAGLPIVSICNGQYEQLVFSQFYLHMDVKL